MHRETTKYSTVPSQLTEAMKSLATSTLVYVSFSPVFSAELVLVLGWLTQADPSRFGLVTLLRPSEQPGTLSCHASSAGAGVCCVCCLLSAVSVCLLSAVCCQDCLGHAFTASLWI